ncbi:MAG: hypothetical protein CL402_08255 [Acidiferrobacteraceae bacterium]|nr:hypothetical protein [Acidiferrobacteraceae bacterium]
MRYLPLNNTILIVHRLSALMMSITLLMTGNSLFSTLVSLRADAENYGAGMIGVMTSAYFLGFAITTLWVGGLINRVGHIRSFAVFASVSTTISLIFLVIIDPWIWVGLRFIMGMCVSGCFVVTESWLNNRATNQNRGLLLSMYMIIIYLAATAGQQMLRIGDPSQFTIFVLASIVLATAIVPVALTKATFPAPVRKPKINLIRLTHISPTAVAGCLIGGIITSSLWGLGPIHAKSLGFTVDQIAIFMSIFVVGGLVFQLPVGRLSDYYDRRKVLWCVTLAALFPSVVLSFGPLITSGLTFISISILGGLVATIYPLSISYANDYLEPDEIISTSAGFVLIFGIGSGLGPIACSALITFAGSYGLFALVTGSLTILTLYISFRMRQRQWVPTHEKEAFVAFPEQPAPTIISDMDPRVGNQKNLDLEGNEIKKFG